VTPGIVWCYDDLMKRTSVVLPDELATLLDRERRRRDVSAATIIREAVEAYLAGPSEPKRYSFIGIGHSGGVGPTAATMEEWLAREARSAEAFGRMKYGDARSDPADGCTERASLGTTSEHDRDPADR
jgi:Ribbon-helix-helix protein, copG family